MNYTEEYKKFIETWGERAQIMMCIEEMSELTQALCKNMRAGSHKDAYSEEKRQEIYENVQEEIADVINCIEQMRLVFGAEVVDKIRQQKIERTLKKLENKG